MGAKQITASMDRESLELPSVLQGPFKLIKEVRQARRVYVPNSAYLTSLTWAKPTLSGAPSSLLLFSIHSS